jgi:hypothetical protein
MNPVDAIPRAASGKYEPFVSHVSAARSGVFTG